MTDKPIKFFFMASITAALQGKPQVRFNTVTALNEINITARVLDMIQQGAASMVGAQEIEFDDLVIENLFCLTPLGCTEEEFTKGTQLAEQLAGAPNTAETEAGALMAEADESAQAEEALTADDKDSIAATVGEAVDAARNSVQDAANEAVAEDHAAAAIGTGNDLSELDAQALEETPVADVTTADVKSQD